MRDRIPRDRVEAIVLDAVRTAPRPITCLDLCSRLTARDCPELLTRPTVTQVLDAVIRMQKDGRLVDTHDPALPGSQHWLTVPSAIGNRESGIGNRESPRSDSRLPTPDSRSEGGRP